MTQEQQGIVRLERKPVFHWDGNTLFCGSLPITYFWGDSYSGHKLMEESFRYLFYRRSFPKWKWETSPFVFEKDEDYRRFTEETYGGILKDMVFRQSPEGPAPVFHWLSPNDVYRRFCTDEIELAVFRIMENPKLVTTCLPEFRQEFVKSLGKRAEDRGGVMDIRITVEKGEDYKHIIETAYKAVLLQLEFEETET